MRQSGKPQWVFRGPRRGPHTAPMPRLRLLLLEDDGWTRTMLANALQGEFEVVAEAADSRSAMRLAALRQPDVAVLDMDLGAGPTGIDVARGLRQRFPALAILVLTSYASPRLFRTNLPQLPPGVLYVRKGDVTDFGALAALIRQAHDGSAEAAAPPLDLSDSQLETLLLLAQGLTNGEIARRRYVSEKAVEQAVAKLARQFDIPQEPATNTRVLLTRAYLRMTGQSGNG